MKVLLFSKRCSQDNILMNFRSLNGMCRNVPGTIRTTRLSIY